MTAEDLKNPNLTLWNYKLKIHKNKFLKCTGWKPYTREAIQCPFAGRSSEHYKNLEISQKNRLSGFSREKKKKTEQLALNYQMATTSYSKHYWHLLGRDQGSNHLPALLSWVTKNCPAKNTNSIPIGTALDAPWEQEAVLILLHSIVLWT